MYIKQPAVNRVFVLPAFYHFHRFLGEPPNLPILPRRLIETSTSNVIASLSQIIKLCVGDLIHVVYIEELQST